MAIQVGTTIERSELDRLLARLARDVSDLRPVWARIDRDVSHRLREQFQSRGASLGTPWAPIAPATKELRIARRILSKRGRARARGARGADTPLRDTGGLYASFTKPGAPGSIRVMDALTYVRGSSYAPDGVPVPVLMQRGFRSTHAPVIGADGTARFVRRRTAKRIPARPIIPTRLPAPVMRAWEGMLVDYLERGSLG